eukprot:TRINITY_DN9859_c1_g1_i1.p2 TRINITY_DN9859_c1_g1~~TRINITY_DN9859_c1_g1_i1.p2  ORF type:complete len:111 (-),score=15.72 TRINITY_DN9859_c1_g1_i1:60-392(-)
MLPLRSSKLNITGQFTILLTMVIADQTFWCSSREALIVHTFVIGFTYLTITRRIRETLVVVVVVMLVEEDGEKADRGVDVDREREKPAAREGEEKAAVKRSSVIWKEPRS